MANLLESSQTQSTTAPSYYNDYLSNVANKATAALDPTTGAQFVGADPLQTKAFTGVEEAAGAYKPTLTDATSTLNTAATNASPLDAAKNYYDTAHKDVGSAATDLMNPYTQNVVNSIADAGQRNIMQNLAPQATAGAVGSGQFGSKRGAEVLGQTIQNANKDILNQQYQALNTGYNSALNAALQKQQLESQMGTSAGQLSSAGTQNTTAAGRAQLEAAKTNQDLGLADINALSTLGAQKQTIAQNKELFPLTNLSTASSLLRGYNVPTSTETKMNMSPLSAAAGIGAGAIGMFTPTGASGKTPFESMQSAYNKMFPTVKAADGSTNVSGVSQADAVTAATNQGYTLDQNTGYLVKDGNNYAFDSNNNPVLVGPVSEMSGGSGATDNSGGANNSGATDNSGGADDVDPNTGYFDDDGNWVPTNAQGGLIHAYANGGSAGAWSSSFAPHMNIGGLPAGGMPQYDQSNTYVGYNDTDGNFVQR